MCPAPIADASAVAETDVFRSSHVADASPGGALHDAVKQLSIAEVQAERARRAADLAEKKDKNSGILVGKLGSETAQTTLWEIEHWGTTLQALPSSLAEAAMAALFPKVDAAEEEEEEAHEDSDMLEIVTKARAPPGRAVSRGPRAAAARMPPARLLHGARAAQSQPCLRRDAACPISTGWRTRRVQLVRGGGRGVSN
jgi:hypothetical protein